jgi:hypothetical protein
MSPTNSKNTKSPRSPTFFSRGDGFQPLNTSASQQTLTGNMASRPNTSGDATVDIPLTPVTTKGQYGAQRPNTSNSTVAFADQTTLSDSQNEKSGLFHRSHGRRKSTKDQSFAKGSGNRQEDDDVLGAMGRFYDKVKNFSIVTRYMLYVLPVSLLLAIPIIIGATAAPKAALGGVRIVWIFAWVEIVWNSLWVSKLFSKILPWLFEFLCGVVSVGTRKYSLIIKSLEIPLSLVFWMLCSWRKFPTSYGVNHADNRQSPLSLS